MSTTVSNNRIHITDATGLKTVFDTDTRMPAIKRVLYFEDIAFPARTVPAGTTVSQDYTLATGLEAEINFIYAIGQIGGSFGSTGNGDNPWENTAMYLASRPWIPMLGSIPAEVTVLTDGNPGAMRAVTVMLSGTTLIVREQCKGGGYPSQALSALKVFLGVV